jgi:hypothetical protein
MKNRPYYGHAQKRHSLGVGSTIKDYDPASWGVEKHELPELKELWGATTPWELDRFADVILWNDIDNGRSNLQEPVILMYEHLKERRKREVYVASGTPDEKITNELSSDGQMIYWRTHPRGRKVNELKQRKKNRASYYR